MNAGGVDFFRDIMQTAWLLEETTEQEKEGDYEYSVSA